MILIIILTFVRLVFKFIEDEKKILFLRNAA